jgi:hypothetical protein
MNADQPKPDRRERIARIILGPKSSWNTGFGADSLLPWTGYPEVARALAKADAILADDPSHVLAEAHTDLARQAEEMADVLEALLKCNAYEPDTWIYDKAEAALKTFRGEP